MAMLFRLRGFGVVPHLVFNRDSDRFIFKPGTNTWVDPATNPAFNDVKNAMSQLLPAALYSNSGYYLSLATMGGSPGWVGVDAFDASGVYLEHLGRIYVYNDTLCKRGFDPDTDPLFTSDSSTWLTHQRKAIATLQNETLVLAGTPDASHTRVEFYYGGTKYHQIDYVNATDGLRDDTGP